MANIQTQDRVEALQRLIQANQLSFFDSLASHPERQQEAVQHLLQAHRESLEETAAEQFSDIPESARRQALDQYMQNLQRQMTSCLVGFAGNQLVLSSLVHVDDYQNTLCYRIIMYLQSLGYGAKPLGNLKQECLKSVGPYGTVVHIKKFPNLAKLSRWDKFWLYFSPSDEGDTFADLCIVSNQLELNVESRDFNEEAIALANNIAHLFQVEIAVQL